MGAALASVYPGFILRPRALKRGPKPPRPLKRGLLGQGLHAPSTTKPFLFPFVGLRAQALKVEGSPSAQGLRAPGLLRPSTGLGGGSCLHRAERFYFHGPRAPKRGPLKKRGVFFSKGGLPPRGRVLGAEVPYSFLCRQTLWPLIYQGIKKVQ